MSAGVKRWGSDRGEGVREVGEVGGFPGGVGGKYCQVLRGVVGNTASVVKLGAQKVASGVYRPI